MSHPINGVETWIFSVLLFMVERVASDPLLLQGASEVTVMMSVLGKHFVSHCRMTSSDSLKREHCQHVSGQSAISGGQMWSGEPGQLQFSVQQHVLICLCFNSGLVV